MKANFPETHCIFMLENYLLEIYCSLDPDRYILNGYRSGDKRSELLQMGVMKRNARLNYLRVA